MAKRCKSKTKSGKPCSAAAGPSGYCGFHDPQHGKARAEGRKRGGRNRTTPHAGDVAQVPAEVRTLDDVLRILDYSLAEALPMENSVQRGRLLVAIARAFVEAIKSGELEERLGALERVLKMREAKE